MRILTLLISLATVSPTAAQTPSASSDDVRIERDQVYLEPGRSEKADLYLPAKPGGKRRPAVLIIHGGGWTSGDKAANREINIGTNLVKNGYVGMSINYVLSTKGETTWPRTLHDCKTAVRWLRM